MGRKTLFVVGTACVAGLFAVDLGADTAEAKNRNRQDEAVIELGRRLFLDHTVSGAGKFSCSSCHEPEHGFSDPRVKSADENGPTLRHSQPVTDLGGEGFHWDGEFDTVRQLLTARLAPPQEALAQARQLHELHFNAAVTEGREPDEKEFRRRIQSLTPPYYGPVTPSGPIATPVPLAVRLEMDGRYDDGFELAFGSADVNTTRIIDAMEAYLGSLKTEESPYDRYRKGDASAMTPAQKRGFAHFKGKAGCASCHVVEGKGARNLTDGKFHNTGVAFRGPLWPVPVSASLDTGRANMSFVKQDGGSFKTPSLRDIARRAPYMHDGSFKTLEEVVRYYDDGGTPNVHLDDKVKALALTDTEVEELVAFLEALSGDVRAGLGPIAAHRPDRHRFKMLTLNGQPMAELPVTVIPTGDRLLGTDKMPEPFTLRTNGSGTIEFPFPASTHVRFETEGHEIGVSRLIPDFLEKKALFVTPMRLASVRLRMQTSEGRPPNTIELRPVREAGVTDDTLIVLRKWKAVAKDEAIYVTAVNDVPAADRAVFPARVNLGDGRAGVGIHEVDLTGGASEPIDLRLKPKPVNEKQRRQAKQRKRRPAGDTAGDTPGRGLKDGPTGRSAPKARGER